jgi:hypothetical protein
MNRNNQENEKSENDKNPEEFDYLKSLRDTGPLCAINFVIDNFYYGIAGPRIIRDYRYKWTYKDDILLLCVLVRKPILSKLIIYYQNSQWQYIRYDYEHGSWNSVICMFLDLRDCVDIFVDKKDRARFLRSIWDCKLNWIIK